MYHFSESTTLSCMSFYAEVQLCMMRTMISNYETLVLRSKSLWVHGPDGP